MPDATASLLPVLIQSIEFLSFFKTRRQPFQDGSFLSGTVTDSGWLVRFLLRVELAIRLRKINPEPIMAMEPVSVEFGVGRTGLGLLVVQP